jgi:hypothetical protein
MQMANAFLWLRGEDYSSMGRFHATSFKSHFSFMKTSRFTITLPAFILAAAFFTNFSHAQTTGSSVPVSNVSRPALPAPTPYTVVSRDANSAIWQRTTYELSPSGQVVPRTHRYTELATGLNFWSNGQWTPSREEVDLLPDGIAAATNGQHQVYFPSDLAQGVIALTTPDGLKLQSQPIALSYDDGSNTVLIAELTNSTGAILPSGNQAIYQNAFTGIAADLLYTYTKAGFEQDIILREQPPDPASFGLNPQTTRLQVLTEFFNPPQPSVRATTVPTAAGNVADDSLGFGMMQIGQGKAFLLGTNSPSVAVNKQWLVLEGRQFLVEEVPVAAIANELLQLPPLPTSPIKLNPLLICGLGQAAVASTKTGENKSRRAIDASGSSGQFIPGTGAGLCDAQFQHDQLHVSRGYHLLHQQFSPSLWHEYF